VPLLRLPVDLLQRPQLLGVETAHVHVLAVFVVEADVGDGDFDGFATGCVFQGRQQTAWAVRSRVGKKSRLDAEGAKEQKRNEKQRKSVRRFPDARPAVG